jgi:hypothetical protein
MSTIIFTTFESNHVLGQVHDKAFTVQNASQNDFERVVVYKEADRYSGRALTSLGRMSKLGGSANGTIRICPYAGANEDTYQPDSTYTIECYNVQGTVLHRETQVCLGYALRPREHTLDVESGHTLLYRNGYSPSWRSGGALPL